MDPNAATQAMLDALLSGDFSEARVYAEDLLEWVKSQGVLPNPIDPIELAHRLVDATTDPT